jgi:hypothetical protein
MFNALAVNFLFRLGRRWVLEPKGVLVFSQAHTAASLEPIRFSSTAAQLAFALVFELGAFFGSNA